MELMVSILIVLDDALLRATMCFFACGQVSLNPYCAGRCSITTCKHDDRSASAVSILIVLDDALLPSIDFETGEEITKRSQSLLCWTMLYYLYQNKIKEKERSLNPYCAGRCSITMAQSEYYNLLVVSILIVLDDALLRAMLQEV